MRRTRPDLKWIAARVAETPFRTLTGVADQMHTSKGKLMDIGALSRAIRGQRYLDIYEVRLLADVLAVPMGELTRRLGVPFGKSDGV